jgi:hypothetical protein
MLELGGAIGVLAGRSNRPLDCQLCFHVALRLPVVSDAH